MAERFENQELGAEIGRLGPYRGLFGFPAPLTGGPDYDRLGFWAPLAADLLGLAVTVTLVLALVGEPVRRQFAVRGETDWAQRACRPRQWTWWNKNFGWLTEME